jgi:hypothetical protein
VPTTSRIKNKVYILQLVAALRTKEVLAVWYQYTVLSCTNDLPEPLHFSGRGFGTNAEGTLAVVRFAEHGF